MARPQSFLDRLHEPLLFTDFGALPIQTVCEQG